MKSSISRASLACLLRVVPWVPHGIDKCREQQHDRSCLMRLKSWTAWEGLMLLYMYIAPRQGPTTPWGQMLMSTVWKPLSLCPIVAKFKTISLKSDFRHVYSCFSTGADNILGTKFWWQQKGLFSLPICCKFQNDLFEIWLYTHF